MDDYLVSVVKDGKVVDLFFSANLSETDALRAIYRGCSIDAFKMPYRLGLSESQTLTMAGDRTLRRIVRCVETSVVYRSVRECASVLGIPVKSIYLSIGTGCAASGLHFEYIYDEK